MPKPDRPKKWDAELERAAKQLEANKARLDSASSMGVASDKTLSGRGYTADPGGGGPTVPRQIEKRQVVKRGKKPKRKR